MKNHKNYRNAEGDVIASEESDTQQRFLQK